MLQKKLELLKQNNQVLAIEQEKANRQFLESELHSQLLVLEKSLKSWEQNNFVMKEYILSLMKLNILNNIFLNSSSIIAIKGKEGDYKGATEETLQLVSELNNLCTQMYHM